MAPHLAPAELNLITQCVAKRMEAPQIWDSIAKLRKKAKVELPKIWVIRRAMAGITHKRGKAESRGRKKKLTGVQANRLFDKRVQLVRKVDGVRYVPAEEIVACARVPHVHRTTAGRYLKEHEVFLTHVHLPG